MKLPVNFRNSGAAAVLRRLLILPVFFLVGCASYPEVEGSVHAQPVGDLLKCADARNQHLPTCYCHSMAIKENPGRQNICSASLDSWLKDELQGIEPRSKEFVRRLRQVTSRLETFEQDQGESWSDTTSGYLAGAEVRDDCDAADSLLDIAFALGGFRLDELAKVLVDSNPNDSRPADHYVAAVWVEGEWMMLDYFISEAQPLLYLEFGGYETKSGGIASESEIIAYRRLSHAKWHAGLPPKIMADTQMLASL